MKNIEEYKNKIDNILQNQQYNMLERTQNGLQFFVSKELKDGKITKNEYEELNEYIERKTKALLKKEETKEFKKQLQVKGLQYTPIYKGEADKLPPKRPTKEGRE